MAAVMMSDGAAPGDPRSSLSREAVLTNGHSRGAGPSVDSAAGVTDAVGGGKTPAAETGRVQSVDVGQTALANSRRDTPGSRFTASSAGGTAVAPAGSLAGVSVDCGTVSAVNAEALVHVDSQTTPVDRKYGASSDSRTPAPVDSNARDLASASIPVSTSTTPVKISNTSAPVSTSTTPVKISNTSASVSTSTTPVKISNASAPVSTSTTPVKITNTSAPVSTSTTPVKITNTSAPVNSATTTTPKSAPVINATVALVKIRNASTPVNSATGASVKISDTSAPVNDTAAKPVNASISTPTPASNANSAQVKISNTASPVNSATDAQVKITNTVSLVNSATDAQAKISVSSSPVNSNTATPVNSNTSTPRNSKTNTPVDSRAATPVKTAADTRVDNVQVTPENGSGAATPCTGQEVTSLAGSGTEQVGTSAARDPNLVSIEIEAIEACQWLRAAGFPQYAQMFEDGLFPLDTWDVQRDHDFLDSDSIQSVIRRLNILNTCAVMKIDAQPSKKATEESDEEDLCALSDRWEYQKTVRRWSRKGPDLTLVVDSTLEPSSSHDSLLGEESGSHTDDSPMLDSKMPHTTAVTTSGEQAPDSSDVVLGVEPPEPLVEGLIPPSSQGSSFPVSPKLRRAASERLKSALKKMESFKKKSKKYPTSRNIVEISDPVVADQEEMQAKLQHLNCVDISPNGVGPTPITKRPSAPVGESTPMDKVSHGIASPDSSSLSPISPASPVVPPPAADAAADSSASSQTDSSSLSEYYTAHTQLLANFQACSGSGKPLGGSLGGRKSSDSSLVEIFLLPQDHKPGSFPRLLKNGYIDTAVPFQASLPAPQAPPSGASLPRDPQGLRGSVGHKGGAKSAASRVSVYDNFPAVGSPQHSAEGNKALEDRLDARLQLGRQSQAVRSLSISSSGSGAKLEAESSESGGMVRSLSASAATSMEFQASSGRASLASDYLGSLRGSTARKSSVAMDEFDAILQNLYQDISNLSRSIGQDEEQEDDLDIVAVRCSSTPSREVTFSITEQNGDIGDHSVDNSTSGSIKLETQLSQTSASETDSFRLGPLSPVCVDDSMEGEEGDLCSQTTSSQDSSDDVEGSADDTLERIALGARERRDSGVGSSLTRASSERKRKKIRWESFQKCHRPSRASRELQIGGLSVCQLLPLRQLSLLKLTSIMEKCSPTNRSQWSWSVPRFMKRNKAPHFSDKNVFGVPFTIMLQRTGQPLPQCVLYAMRYLRKTSHDALGIFRKSGVRSRIQKLRDLVESNPDSINFDELQPYDVADLLKQYFRELPECLLTNKLSDTFRSIFTHVPQSQRLEALQTAVILLPEENREVLHCLLLFLGDIAQHADKHQMNASNLAVCFAPSLFNFLGSHGTNSPRRQRKTPGVPEQRELLEQKAVHECFTYMITDCKKLFMVPPSMYSRLHLSTLSNMEPVHLDEFYAKSKQPGPDFKAFGEEHIQMLLKEVHDKARGWVPATVGVPGIEALHRKPQDGHPLRQWKCSVEIEAPPVEVLNRILHERHKWDDDMLSWDVVERLDRNSDVFHYVLNTMAPHPPRHFMVIRYWRPDLVKGACALVSKSVEHSGALAASAEYDQGVRAVELGSFYLMEPCGSGRSRLTYISRTDLRGRCPEWYNRVFGHMCANFLDRLRDSFRQEADGPETKV